ncbi:MAG: hypothetical protein EA412_04900 [Chitinophagaceae bacterium]|jgi:hypothetical protein|nr:MAG: hypothetical protein EA412_04900 [Chitinophagaceae bacterium]
MKNLFKQFITLLFFGSFFVISFNSCKKDKSEDPYKELKANITIEFKAVKGEENLILFNQYMHPLGYPYQLEMFMSYFHDIYLIDIDENKVLLSDVMLVKFNDAHMSDDNSGVKFNFEVPKGAYNSISFGIGVGEDKNFSDPAQYPQEHPLSIYHGTHWDWNTGYIFTKIEGRVNTDPGQSSSYNRALLYHTGLEDLYREVVLTFPVLKDFTADADNKIRLEFDMDKILENPDDMLDFATENSTHTLNNFELAERVVNNLVSSISVE